MRIIIAADSQLFNEYCRPREKARLRAPSKLNAAKINDGSRSFSPARASRGIHWDARRFQECAPRVDGIRYRLPA